MIMTGIGCLLLISSLACDDDAQKTPTSKTSQAQVFVVPGKKYGLSIDLKDFAILKDERPANYKSGRYVMATRDGSGLSASFWLLPAEGKGDSVACRKVWWAHEAKNPITPLNIEKKEKGDLAIVYYTVSVGPIEQANARVYIAHKNTWIDIHLSLVGASRKDFARFDRIIDSIKIVDPCSGDSGVKKPAIAVKKEISVASRLYLQRDFTGAATHYQKALDAEKKSRTLSQRDWRIMVDNLGMSYGLQGNAARAKTIFEYGIKEDPKYPMFHYNLACAWAELDSLPNALPHLKRAYELKKNMLPGEQIPDPRTDSSFKKFRNSPEFKATLEEIGL